MSALPRVIEDYLKALYAAEERDEPGLGVTELAHAMGVAVSTASENVKKLHRFGLVDREPYQKPRLSESGRKLAREAIWRHRVLETYLYERLGFDWDQVHREAEMVEHAMSDALVQRMDQVLGYPSRDPHGDPIPRDAEDADVPRPQTLLLAPTGTPLVVARLSDDKPALLRLLDSLGIVLDARVQIIQKLAYAGMLTLQVTPPATWVPRNASQLSKGVAPGATTRIDLSDTAASAVLVVAPSRVGQD